ncbi:MAG TPA: hypothetical protein VIV60_08885, partial [Polyangiaceae bacterium]
MKAKFGLVLLLVVAFALLIAACAPAPTAVPTAPPPTTAPSGAATSAPSGAATSAPAAGGKFTCSDKLGCIDIGPNDPVHIAYAFVTSGENSTLGLDTKYGAELAVD